MHIESVGLITYHHPHLKTEQVLQRLLSQDFDFKMFALPFKPRKPRQVLLAHRPDQARAVAPDVMAQKHDIPYIKCSDDTEIDGSCDFYLILGAGILSAACLEGKRIVNCHPGIIPASRGLDSFKWSILDMKPLGITLHYIDAQVDAGEVISVIPTNVYPSDDLTTLARRHYENEIDCLSRFHEYLGHPHNPFPDIEQGEARMRMPREKESAVVDRISDYVATYGR